MTSSKRKQGKNTKAMLTASAVRGIKELLNLVSIPANKADNSDILRAIDYMNKTVNLFNSPEAIAKRERMIEYKKNWKRKRNK